MDSSVNFADKVDTPVQQWASLALEYSAEVQPVVSKTMLSQFCLKILNKTEQCDPWSARNPVTK